MVDLGTKHLVDVGTDHAYLPIYLVENGIVESCIALDRLTGPLLNAKKNIQKYGVEASISPRLSEGLSKVSPNEADTVVMAGIGSENIVNIIEQAPWLKNPKKSLVLQPMTKEELLRVYLAKNSFVVEKKELCVESKKVYVVFKARFCNKNLSYFLNDSRYIFFVIFSKYTNNKNSRLYINKQIEWVRMILRNEN